VFLNGANVIAVLEQSGSKRMAKSVTTDQFDEAGDLGSVLDRTLEVAFVDVVAAQDSRAGITGETTGTKTRYACRPHSRLALGYLRSNAPGR
jgi:hypothetical protein